MQVRLVGSSSQRRRLVVRPSCRARSATDAAARTAASGSDRARAPASSVRRRCTSADDRPDTRTADAQWPTVLVVASRPDELAASRTAARRRRSQSPSISPHADGCHGPVHEPSASTRLRDRVTASAAGPTHCATHGCLAPTEPAICCRSQPVSRCESADDGLMRPPRSRLSQRTGNDLSACARSGARKPRDAHRRSRELTRERGPVH